MAHVGRFFFGAQFDAADVRNAHDPVGILADDEALELGWIVQVGVDEEIDLHVVALGAPDGREEVVAAECGFHRRGAEAEGGKTLGIEPDAHGLRARAFQPDALHVGQRAEARLDVAREVVRQLRRGHLVGGDADVEGGVGPVGALHLDAG